jgi:FkbM family methyltransferase
VSPSEKQILEEFIPTLPTGATIVEAGMCDGDECESILKLLPGPPRAYCGFEPDPRGASIIRSKGLDKRINFYEYALTDHNGAVVLNMSDGGIGENRNWHKSSTIMDPAGHKRMFPEITFPDTRRLSVPCMTLDGICEAYSITTLDLLWMDVEGAEISIVRGGKRMIPNTRFIWTEVWNVGPDEKPYVGMCNERELLDALPGFEVVKRLDFDVLLKNSRIA